eukprot:COSAG02_NODE_791_length_17158_cov_12.377396_2_plen_68_part_00
MPITVRLHRQSTTDRLRRANAPASISASALLSLDIKARLFDAQYNTTFSLRSWVTINIPDPECDMID